mgnify:FL=1
MTYVGSRPANKPVNQTDIEDDAISLAKLAGGTDGNIISYDASGNPVAIATGNDGMVLTSTGAGSPPAFESVVVPALRPNSQSLIINGNMSISQRATSFSPSGAGTNYTIDRYSYDVTGSGTGDATITQESDAPPNTNFRKSLKISPDATETLSGGENIVFATPLEGQNVQVLGHGISSPPKATLSFWVKSSKTGTYCVQIKEESISNESYLLYEYSISSANTWEQKVFTWTGNTAHTLNDNNAMGFRIVWHLAVGSDDHASATTSWTASTAFKATSNQVNFFDSTSNNWYLTGVQLEIGEFTSSTLPPFQHENVTDNLLRCQRYFRSYGGGHATEQVAVGYTTGAQGETFINYSSPVMRATPTMSLGTIGNWKIYSNSAGYTCSGNPGASDATPRNMKLLTDHASGATAGQGGMLQANGTTNARLTLSSEL